MIAANVYARWSVESQPAELTRQDSPSEWCGSPVSLSIGEAQMTQAGSARCRQVVALFNASDDTVEMVQRMLDASDFNCLIGCHFSDLKNGRIDFAQYLARHDPDVVVFDISPPYKENWEFFKTLRDAKAMKDRGLVLTTTNKARLDETVGKDSDAFEIVGKPYDLDQIKVAIHAARKRPVM
jgi:DNA-binding response OmpR family regulator